MYQGVENPCTFTTPTAPRLSQTSSETSAFCVTSRDFMAPLLILTVNINNLDMDFLP